MSDLSDTTIAKWLGEGVADTAYGGNLLFGAMHAAHERLWSRRWTLYHGYGWWYMTLYVRLLGRMLRLDWHPGRHFRMSVRRK